MNNTILNKEVAQIIYEQIDPWIFQAPEKTKDDIFVDIEQDIKSGKSLPLEKDGFILYIVPETKWLARVHMFAKNNSPIKSLKAGIFLTDLIFNNSKVMKLYGITPLKSMVKVSERIGWKHEGTITKSFMTKEGDLKDQYVFGITREENKQWREIK
jgi:hypothetical protein